MKPIALTTLTLLFAASCSPSNDAENPGKSGSQAGDEKPAVEAPAKIPSGNVDLATAKQLFDDAKAGKSKLVILDVRTDEEFKDGHLEGAVNIDYLVPEAVET